MRISMIVLRLALAINFLRYALSFVPYFEGTAKSSGLADQIFPGGDGFRFDVQWLIVTTVFIAVAMLLLLFSRQSRSRYKIEIIFSALWIVAFIAYFVRAMLTGLLDMG